MDDHPTPAFVEAVQQMVRDALHDQARLVETACEKALAGGEHGVLVLRAGINGTIVSAEPDPSVPYGLIHDRPLQ